MTATASQNPVSTTDLNPVVEGQVVTIGGKSVTPLPSGNQLARVAELKKELNVNDTQSIMSFGVKAQGKLNTVASDMLKGVKSKDVGPAGDLMVSMVTKIRGLDLGAIDPKNQPGMVGKIWGKVTGAVSPVAKFVQQYEEVETHVNKADQDLERHRITLLRDVEMLDRLYEESRTYLSELDLYIAAIGERIEDLNNTEIPALAKIAEESGDLLDAQNLRDLTSRRDDMERKRSDLLLTRQVTLQSLPSIRLTQENDAGLINKIQSQRLNTLPLWRTQLATAITMYRTVEAGKTTKAVSDLTNDLLASNAKTLRTSNALARTEMERGVFDIEVVKAANAELIATLDDSIRIAEEGKAKRQQVEKELVECENTLKNALRGIARSNTPLLKS